MENLVARAYFSADVMKKRSHYHDCHQIIYITKGKAGFCVNEANFEAGAGSLMVFSRYENHSITICSEEYERYVLHINSAVDISENKVYSVFSNRPAGFSNHLDVSDNAALFEALFAQITEEYSAHRRMSEDMTELLINQLLILICRRLPDSFFTFDEQNFETVSSIQKRFESEYFKAYTLEGLAKEYSISPSSLSHQFKRITGSSVMGYLLSCRMATAKKYLTKTKLSISEIVERCGFSDNSNFSRTFKALSGLSPSEFRNKYK